MEMQAFFGSFALLCFVKISREIYIEKYKEFNGVNLSSNRARTKVLASFESHYNYWGFNGIKTPSMKARTKVLASFEAGMNSPNLSWKVNIISLKHRS